MEYLKKVAESVTGEVLELQFNLSRKLQSGENEEDREARMLAESHRFDSFSPIREHGIVKWFVDGKDYFCAVSEALETAKEVIYIEDWWLSPELFMRRTPAEHGEHRLDNIIKRKADEGVKVYVVVYQEVEHALTLNSNHTKTWLEGLSPNIVVQRHPNHVAIQLTLFWAHHEKICVIDNRIGFIGGLDLCFGRWDTHTHPLADFHPTSLKSEVWPGQDYSNPRIKDFEQVDQWQKVLIDKRGLARMPWHDVSIGVVGRPVLDIARHFIQRWNFVKQEKSMDRKEVTVLEYPIGSNSITMPTKFRGQDMRGIRYRHQTANINGNMHCQVLRSSAEWSMDIPTERSIQNAYIDSIAQAEHFVYIENQFFITATDDDPKNVIKNQIGKALVDRILRAYEEKKKFRVIVVMPLIPAFPAELSTKDAATVRLIMHWQYVSISRGGKSIIDLLKAGGIQNPEDYISFFSLRNYDRINHTKTQDEIAEASGVDAKEREAIGAATGDHRTKGKLVKDAEPVFVKGTEGSESYNHPIKALKNKLANTESVIIPSASQAELLKTQDEVYALQKGRVKNNISQHAMLGGSIEAETWLDGKDAQAQHEVQAENNERQSYITEELYIHTKVLIVDDRKVIVGSANLNDRSQCGDHDSEIAMLIEDQDLIDSTMGGEPCQVARFATSLRRHLFREHLGLIGPEDVNAVSDSMLPPPHPQAYDFGSEHDRLVADPLSDEFYRSLWWQTAETNTGVFRDLFHCVPDDSVTTWDEYKAFYKTEPNKNDADTTIAGHIYSETIPVTEIRANLAKVHGHLVHFPTRFLEKVDLMGESIVKDLVMNLYT